MFRVSTPTVITIKRILLKFDGKMKTNFIYNYLKVFWKRLNWETNYLKIPSCIINNRLKFRHFCVKVMNKLEHLNGINSTNKKKHKIAFQRQHLLWQWRWFSGIITHLYAQNNLIYQNTSPWYNEFQAVLPVCHWSANK